MLKWNKIKFKIDTEKKSFIVQEKKLFQKKYSENFTSILEAKLGVKSFKRSKSQDIEDQI